MKRENPKKMYIDVASLIVATLAFVISGITWWEGRAYQKAQYKPKFTPDHARVLHLGKTTPNKGLLFIYLKNTGTLDAKRIDAITVNPIPWVGPGDEARRECPEQYSRQYSDKPFEGRENVRP